MCVCVGIRFLISKTHINKLAWDSGLKFSALVKGSRSFIYEKCLLFQFMKLVFMKIWFYGALSFSKKTSDRYKSYKFWAVLKLYANIIYQSRTFGIWFGQDRLNCSNFSRFWILCKFSVICVTLPNFKLFSSNLICEWTNTKYYLVLNFLRIGRGF